MAIEVQAIGESKGRVDVMGVIGSDDANMKKFAEDLRALGDVEELEVNVASFGGSVPQGLAMHSQLERHPAKVTVNIDGLAFSMASYIPTAADHVRMSANGLMMIHNPRMPDRSTGGESSELRRRADAMDKSAAIMAKGYAKKSGKSIEEVERIMSEETWYTAEEALEAGFIDEISGAEASAISFDLIPGDLRVPAHVSGQFFALFGVSEQPPTEETPEEVETMATTPEKTTVAEPQGPVAATLEQLEALKGADETFVLTQMRKKATLEDAKDELNALLLERLEAKDAEIEAVRAEQPEVVEHGVEALSTDTPGADVTAESVANPKGTYRQLLEQAQAEAVASGKTFSPTQASQKIRKERPELFEAMGVRAEGRFWQ